MKKFTKRFLSILMAAAIVASLIPMGMITAQAKIMNWTPICSSDFTGSVDGNGQYPTYNSQGAQMGWGGTRTTNLYMTKYNNQTSTLPLGHTYSWKIDVGFKLTGDGSSAVTAAKQYAFMRLGVYTGTYYDDDNSMTAYTYYCQDAHGNIYSWEDDNYGGTDSANTSISVNNPYLEAGVNYHYIAEFDYERLNVYITNDAGVIICQIAATSTPATFLSRLTNIHDHDVSVIKLGRAGSSASNLPGIEYNNFTLYSGEETHVTNTSGKYLFAYFTGNGNCTKQDYDNQAVRYALSEDGRNFTPLNGNDPVITQTKGTLNCRDPYIFKDPDGSYYCIATDMDAHTDASGTYQSGSETWWGNSNSMVLWHSTDLINWTDETIINMSEITGADDIQRCWAPQIIWDATAQKYVVYFGLASYSITGNRTVTYYCYTDDLLNQSHYQYPVEMLNPGTGAIDADIFYNNTKSQYYCYYKNEDAGSIRFAVSNTVTGPYTDKGSVLSGDDWKAISGCADNKKSLEGSACYFVGDDIYMMCDNYENGKMVMLKSSDWETWHVLNDADYDTYSFGVTRHPSVIQISDAQYNALIAEYGDKEYSFHENFSVVGNNGWAGWHWDGGAEGFYSAKTANNDEACVYTFANSNYISIYKGCLFVEDWTVRRLMAGHTWTASLNVAVTTKEGTPIISLTSGASESNNNDWFRILDTGEISIYNGSSYEQIGTTTIEEAVEYSFHITYDNTTLKVYQNGELVCQTAWSNGYNALASNNYVGIGFSDKTNKSTNYFRGTISKLRFRMGALNAAQVSGEYNENLLYQKSGNDVCDDLPNSIDASTSFVTTDEYNGSLSNSITVAAWVNPGSSVGGANAMLSFGNGGSYANGQYFVLAENGEIYYQWGDGTNEHYVTVYDGYTLTANTWSLIQINIIPYRNSVRLKTWQDGVATSDTYCHTSGTNMTGFDNLPINFFSQSSMKITYGTTNSPWWAGDGSVYLSDIRVYGKALHNFYDEAKETFENDIAKNYVEDNLADYDVTAAKNKATRKAYHYGNEATNGYNNVLACSTSTVCANDYYDRNWGLYKFFWPSDIVLMYDGVNTPALPVTFESKEHNGTGHPNQKQLYTIFATTANFSNAHYWTGYIDANTVSNPWTVWPESYRPYNYADGLKNSNNSLANYNYIGWGDGADYDYYYYYNNTGNPRWFWNKVNYTGNMSSNTVYKETYTAISYRIWDGSGQDIPGNATGESHNIYIINYKPIYDILNGTTTITHGSGTYTLKELYAHVHANETMYTENSVNNFYKAAYEILTANPNRISEAAYQAHFEDEVDAAVDKIEDAVTAFNNISLKTRADFTDLDTKYNNALNIVNTLNTENQIYTTSTIIALRDVIGNLVYEPNDGDPYRPNVEAFASSSAILAEKDAIDDAVAALDRIYDFDSYYAAYLFDEDYEPYDTYNEIWQYSTDILDTKGTDAQAYTTTTVEALGNVINDCYYSPVLNRVPDRKDIGVNSDGAAIAAEVNAMDNAIAYLAAVANFSELDTAYANGDALLKELSEQAPQYTEDSVNALITAVNNGKANATASVATKRDTSALSAQSGIDNQKNAINSAIAGLETAKPTAFGEESADYMETYRAAVNAVKHFDPDLYSLNKATIDDNIATETTDIIGTSATYTVGEVDYDIQTVDEDATKDNVVKSTNDLLGLLTTNYVSYKIYIKEGTVSSVASDGKIKGSVNAQSGTDANGTYSYTGAANSGIVATAPKETAWYMSYTSNSGTTRSKQYQEYGSTFSTKLIGNMNLYAVQRSAEAPNKVRVERSYSDNTSIHPVQCIDFVNGSYELPEAPAIPFYTFQYYSYNGNTYSAGQTISGFSSDITVKAVYNKVSNNAYTVKVSKIGGDGDVFDGSAEYNTKIIASDPSAYAWTETVGTKTRIYSIGSDLTFFVTESATYQAITKAQFDAAEYSVPQVNLRNSGAVITDAGSGKHKLTFNAQVVLDSNENAGNQRLVECGILVGKATTGTITDDNMALEFTGTQDGYKVLRAKSTMMVGANQFTIGVTTNMTGTFKYRGYAIYQVGASGDYVTVYSDVVDANIG